MRNETYQYTVRIYNAAEKYLKEVDKLSNDYHVHNLIIDFRNEMCTIIGEIYQQLSIKSSLGLDINTSKRETRIKPAETSEQECVICGENRIVNSCHIIPREHHGSYSKENFIFLCPTHHHLFDHAHLSEDEFNKIDLKGKRDDSKTFFDRVHKKRHQMYWKYKTNKFTGCNCGSTEFWYSVIHHGICVQPCLVCKNCKEKWYLGADHPLKKYEIKIANEPFELNNISPSELEKKVIAAQEKIYHALQAQFGDEVIKEN